MSTGAPIDALARPRIQCQECRMMLEPAQFHDWPECIERRFFGSDRVEDADPAVRNTYLTGALRILLDYIEAKRS